MKTSITIQNLKCGGCTNTITTKLLTIENISNLQVDLEKSKVSFDYLKETDVEQVKQKLKHLGYPSIDDDNTLVSKAKSFVSCATGKMSN